MKKILSFILAGIMIMSLGVAAFAVDFIDLEPAKVEKDELIALNMLDLDAEGNSVVMAGAGGTYYLMLDPTVNYTNVSITASGNVAASVVKYDMEKYEPIPGLTYGVWKRTAGEWIETGLTYEEAKQKADDLNMEYETTTHEVRPEGYTNIFVLEIADNYGRAYAEGKLTIKAYNEDLKQSEGASIKVIRDVSIFGYEKVKYAAEYETVLDQTYTGYSDYWTSQNGYDTSTVYSDDPTVISTTAFRAITGKDISIEMAGLLVNIENVASGQRGVNFLASGIQEKDYNKDKQVDAITFGFPSKHVINSDFEIVVDTDYTWFTLRELFGVRLEEDDIITYTLLKDGKVYCDFDVDYSTADYNAPIKLIIDGKAGETLGEYELVVGEVAETEAEVETTTPAAGGEENPNTGAPSFFEWLFSLIFG